MADDNTQTNQDQTQDQKDNSQDSKQDQKQDSKVDARTTEALELLDMLEDPEQRLAFVKNLATQAGLLTAETKKDEKAAKKVAKDIIKAHLGEEYKGVAEKLGSAIDELLEERLGEVNGRLNQSAQSQAERQFSSDFDTFISANEVSDDEAGLILKQLEVMSPNPKVPLKKFLAEQLELVRYRTGKTTDNKERLKRQADNFNRRAASHGQDSGEKTISAPKSFSVRDAVQAAARGEKWS